MAIITAQAEGVAEVTLDARFCNACGLCVDVCPGGALHEREGRVVLDHARFFGCIGCGACMVVCPRDAISVRGRGLSPEDVTTLPARTAHAGYPELLSLMRERRSCRRFAPTAVAPEHVQEILAAAQTAPVSVPPSGVGVIVLHGAAGVQGFRRDLVDVIRRRRWLWRAPAVWCWRPFLSRAQWGFLRSFVEPMFDAYLGQRPEFPADQDRFFYDAPLAIYFYPSETSDPADAPIAATHALLAAEALGYGTCFLGFPGYLLALDRNVSRRYGVPSRSRPGLTLLVGHAGWRSRRTVQRHFARCDWRNGAPARNPQNN